MPARPEVAAQLAEPDPPTLLAGFGAITTAINQRTNDVYRMLVSAAGPDPAAAELLDDIRHRRVTMRAGCFHTLRPPETDEFQYRRAGAAFASVTDRRNR